jgi:ABC-type polysaccharide/polyol phosphate export permease
MLAGAIQSLQGYLREVWDCRFFWMHLVKSDLQKRYRRSFLGVGWSLLQPLSMALILTAVYSRVMGVGFWQFGPSLLAGVAFWALFQQSCLQGCMCFIVADPYLRQQPLPSIIFPLRTVLLLGFHFVLSLLLAAVFGWMGAGKVMLGGLLAALPAVLLLLVFCWSMATIAAYSHVYLPDTQHLLEVGLQMLFYLTPIIYPAALLHGNGLGWLLDVNPLATFLDLLRTPLLTGEVPPPWLHVKGLLMALPAVGLAVALVARLERDLIFAL